MYLVIPQSNKRACRMAIVAYWVAIDSSLNILFGHSSFCWIENLAELTASEMGETSFPVLPIFISSKTMSWSRLEAFRQALRPSGASFSPDLTSHYINCTRKIDSLQNISNVLCICRHSHCNHSKVAPKHIPSFYNSRNRLYIRIKPRSSFSHLLYYLEAKFEHQAFEKWESSRYLPHLKPRSHSIILNSLSKPPNNVIGCSDSWYCKWVHFLHLEL